MNMDNQVITIADSKSGQHSAPREKTAGRATFQRMSWDLIAVVFWTYVMVKLLIFDVDNWIIQRYAPDHAWLLNLKFFLIIGCISILWLITKNKKLLTLSAYILFYPGVILFWKIPLFVYKQKSWLFAFGLATAIISFFKSARYNFIYVSTFLISAALILNFTSTPFLWLPILAIFALLLITYVHRFLSVFKPSNIFQVYTKVFSSARRSNSSFSLDDAMKNLPVETLDEKQLEKWTTKLQTAVLFNRLCLFTARKVRDYQRVSAVSYVLTLLLLIAFTAVSFAFINMGIYKVDQNSFSAGHSPNFFTFFYYSFNLLFFNLITEVTPITVLSKLSLMSEYFLVLFLVVIFVSLLFSVKSPTQADELSKVIRGLEKEGEFMEGFIRDEYKMDNIQAAMIELERLKAGSINFIYQISRGIG